MACIWTESKVSTAHQYLGFSNIPSADFHLFFKGDFLHCAVDAANYEASMDFHFLLKGSFCIAWWMLWILCVVLIFWSAFISYLKDVASSSSFPSSSPSSGFKGLRLSFQALLQFLFLGSYKLEGRKLKQSWIFFPEVGKLLWWFPVKLPLDLDHNKFSFLFYNCSCIFSFESFMRMRYRHSTILVIKI